MKKTALSGCQVTGTLHLGNYLGSIIHWIKMQDEYDCYFFLADLHSITVDSSPSHIHSSTLETTAIYLALGIDPNKTVIFAQNMVHEHAELAWILNCTTPLGWLKRMTQFKDKAGKDQEDACLGLLSYPVLMAADILLYNADLVPVGEDQKQHLELTRDIASMVNRKLNKAILKLPEPLIFKSSARIMSLKDGKKKMSKSDSSDLSRINLTDNPDLIRHKIKKAKTDLIDHIDYDPATRPEISNLISIYSIISNDSIDKIVEKYASNGFAKFKEDLSSIIIETLKPANQKYQELIKDEHYLMSVLQNGAARARIKAAETLNNVKSLFGFIV